jgi:hypothetical protein
LTPKVLWTRRRDAYYDYGTETVGDIIGKSAGGSCCCDLVLAARSSDLVDGSAASADYFARVLDDQGISEEAL